MFAEPHEPLLGATDRYIYIHRVLVPVGRIITIDCSLSLHLLDTNNNTPRWPPETVNTLAIFVSVLIQAERKVLTLLEHGVPLPTAKEVSSNGSTPQASESGSSDADIGYFAHHGITSGPNDDFNSLFNRLVIREGLSKTQRRKRRHEAIAGEINAIYGTDATKLEKWQELCRDVKIEPIPLSINKCKKVCRHTRHVAGVLTDNLVGSRLGLRQPRESHQSPSQPQS